MPTYAILVDGGFLKRKLGSAKAPMTADDFAGFITKLMIIPQLVEMRLHRIYFYDAAPLTDSAQKPLNGGKIDFGKQPIALRNRDLHDKLTRIGFVALRQGELLFRGWKVSRRALPDKAENVTITEADLTPDIQQKGVDMRIGLDIAALTLKKQVDVIVLITGDSDFVPAMKFARREGAQLFLVPLGHGIRDVMREHADLVIDL